MTETEKLEEGLEINGGETAGAEMAEPAKQRVPSRSRRMGFAGVGLGFLLVVGIRWRVREMPLERDEGEYAYAGQLILQGIPPYEIAYNMKLPGTYVAYAATLRTFGETASAIH